MISGLLVGLSFCSPNLSFLVWFSLVPFIYVINRSRIRAGVIAAIVFAVCYYGTAIFWVGRVTADYSAKLGLGVLLIYLSFYCPYLFSCTVFNLKHRQKASLFCDISWTFCTLQTSKCIFFYIYYRSFPYSLQKKFTKRYFQIFHFNISFLTYNCPLDGSQLHSFWQVFSLFCTRKSVALAPPSPPLQ